jgi:hypothetical protein
MGLRQDFNLLPKLLPGEKVLFVKRWVWAASSRSFPGYRLDFSLPPLEECGLFVTDRRVLCHYLILRLMVTEFSQWFEGKAEPGDREVLKEVSVGRSRLFVPYLELISKDPARHWYRSRRMCLHIFTREAEAICRVVSDAMAAGTAARTG